MVVWLIGLSGSGKTTVGNGMVERVRSQVPTVVFVDGDLVRKVWGDDPGHTIEGRYVNAGRISRLCRFLDGQGVHVVAAVLSIFPEWQSWNRSNFSQYFEVFLDTPMAVLRRRDTKGLYEAAESGRMHNVVGVDIDFPPPPNADLVVDTSEYEGEPDALVEMILGALPSFDGWKTSG